MAASLLYSASRSPVWLPSQLSEAPSGLITFRVMRSQASRRILAQQNPACTTPFAYFIVLLSSLALEVQVCLLHSNRTQLPVLDELFIHLSHLFRPIAHLSSGTSMTALLPWRDPHNQGVSSLLPSVGIPGNGWETTPF